MAQTAARRVQQLREHFAAKNEVLSAALKPLSPLEYYEFIFKDLDAPRLYVVENKTYTTALVDDLFDIATMRADIYVPPCDFFNNFYSLKTLSKLYALVIDVDNMTPIQLQYLISELPNTRIPSPSMIGNSGSGVHLYYVFSEPVDAYRRRIPAIKGMVNELHNLYHKYGKVDKNSLIQAYRLPGSHTKLGDTMTGYQSGPAYDAKALAAQLSIDVSHWERTSVMEQPPNEINGKANRPKKAVVSKNITVMPRVNHGHLFYEHSRFRVFRETEVSHRYTSMVALAIIAYKARISREKVEYELGLLAGIWSERNPENPVDPKEVQKAMKAYSPDFVKVTAAQLEEYFGWKFYRKIPRRGRTQEEHLKRIAMRKRGYSRELLMDYLKDHPDATQRDIESALKMSPKTIVKYRRQIQGK